MSTITQARTRKRAAPPPVDAADLSDQIVLLPLALIDPHPMNPGRTRITSENTQQLAADIAAHGMQQPIKVRPRDGGRRYQIIFGERRYRAALELKHKTIEARIQDASDAETLTLMAVENGQREDIDALAIARHLVELTDAGLTQAQAGACYGVSQGEVANRIRLLRLPQGWQDLVTSGEIPAKQARLLVPYTDAPAVLEQLLTKYKGEHWYRSDWNAFAADDNLEAFLVDEAEAMTRPIDEKQKHHYPWPTGNHPRYFELTDALREQLGVVLLPLGERPKKGAQRPTVERATNVKLWEKLNKPLVDAAVNRKESRHKSPGGQPSQAKKPAGELTKEQRVVEAAAQRKAREQRKVQLRQSRDAWRLRMLRLTTSQQIKAGDWRTNLAAAYCFHTWYHARESGAFAELLNIAADELAGVKGSHVRESVWGSTAPLLAKLVTACGDDGDEIAAAERILASIVRITLWPTSAMVGPRGKQLRWVGPGDPAWQDPIPTMPAAAVEQLAELWHVSIEDGWRAGAILRTPQRELIAQALQLHRKAELLELAAELGVELSPTVKHTEAVGAILAAHTKEQPLKLPSCFKSRKTKKGRQRNDRH